MLTFISTEQPLNADAPIDVTEFGMATLTSLRLLVYPQGFAQADLVFWKMEILLPYVPIYYDFFRVLFSHLVTSFDLLKGLRLR